MEGSKKEEEYVWHVSSCRKWRAQRKKKNQCGMCAPASNEGLTERRRISVAYELLSLMEGSKKEEEESVWHVSSSHKWRVQRKKKNQCGM